MKILRFLASTSLKSGGPQNGIKSLSPYLEKNNVSTNIISLDENLEEIKGVEKIVELELSSEETENFKNSISAVRELFSAAKKIDKELG